MYRSTKKYGHERGLSCAFRQWRAESHCKYLHGYSLAFEFTFESEEVDVRNWCVDFGSLKSLKEWLDITFDHTVLVAADDPQINLFRLMCEKGTIQMREVEAVGCEKIAELVYGATEVWLKDNGYSPRVHLHSVQVWEHPSNSAIFKRSKTEAEL